MSDIQEEQKRLYKRAEENDIKLLKEEINRLNNIINEAIGFTNSHFKEMVADEEAQALLNILNKGENNE